MSVTLSNISTSELNANGLRIHSEIVLGNQPINALLAGYNAINGQYKPMEDDGTDQMWPAEFGDHSQPTELLSGYEPINLTAVDTINQQFNYPFWFVTYPVIISKVEQIKNQGKARIFDLQKQRIENVQRAAFRRMETHLLQGGQAGHSRLNHFNGVDYAAGLFEASAPGSQTHSVGGLSKSTYSAYPLLDNQYFNCAGSVNSLGWEAIQSIQANVRVDSQHPDAKAFWVASPGARIAFGRLTQAHIVIQGDAKNYDMAGPGLMIGGNVIYESPYMPLAGATSATTKVSLYRICPMDQPVRWVRGQTWEMGEWIGAQGSATLVAQIDAAAQLMPLALASGGMITNAETF